jgi:hypothetical protein
MDRLHKNVTRIHTIEKTFSGADGTEDREIKSRDKGNGTCATFRVKTHPVAAVHSSPSQESTGRV